MGLRSSGIAMFAVGPEPVKRQQEEILRNSWDDSGTNPALSFRGVSSRKMNMNSVSQKAKDIFVSLVDDVPPEEWDDRVDEACRGMTN